MSTLALVLVSGRPGLSGARVGADAPASKRPLLRAGDVEEAAAVHRDQQALRDRLEAPTADERADPVSGEHYAVRP